MRIQDENDHFTDYQIRDLRSGFFEVTKWEGGRRPTQTYRVVRHDRGYECNCPVSFRGKCKHVNMVQTYEKLGRPATFPTLEKLEPL